ncbi:cation-transporting P-type ATPase [Sinomonas sp. R1AF57]
MSATDHAPVGSRRPHSAVHGIPAGLDEAAAAALRERVGPNVLPRERPRP